MPCNSVWAVFTVNCLDSTLLYTDMSLASAPYGIRSHIASWFICCYWRHINRLFVYFNFLTSFLILFFLLICFLTHLLPDLPTPCRIDPFHFQVRRPNLVWVFCVNYFARGSSCEVLWWVRLCVCPSVCLSVCPRGYLRSHTRDFYQMFCARCLCLWLGPPSEW